MFETRSLAPLLLSLALAAMPAVAETEGEAPLRPEQKRVLLGTCELVLDPTSEAGRRETALLGCFKASIGGEITFVSGTPEENSWLKYGNLYGGMFLNRWMSIQGRGRARENVPLGKVGEERRDIVTDYAVLQLGNPALHGVRITAGKMRLPFGIDRTEASQHYQAFEDRRFWASPEHGLALTIDNLHTSQVELGYGTNGFTDREIPDADETAAPALADPAEEGKVPLVQAASLRFTTDFAALDGSRMVLSTYGEEGGVRRMGAGFLSVSRKDDVTLFEFVRRLESPDGDEVPFAQLLRIGYIGAWRGTNRWIVQFDDERYRFRRGTMNYDINVYDHALVRFGVSYHKSETGDGLRRWYVTSGLEARL